MSSFKVHQALQILLLSVTVVLADDNNWISNVDGGWSDPNNWSLTATPGSMDDTHHLNQASRIEMDTSGECLSFEGKGTSTVPDRYVVIEASEVWAIGTGGLSKASGSDENFIVRYQGGLLRQSHHD